MFTGIVESVGTVADIKKTGSIKLYLNNPSRFEDIRQGSSISVNGVCLTALDVGMDADQLITFEVSQETAARSNLKDLRRADKVNLERALPASGRFEGHIVLGHVDITVELEGIEKRGSDNIYSFKYEGSGEYLIEKGSIALNGISLTVFGVKSGRFSCVVLPYTSEKTNLRYIRSGDRLNCEMDVLGKFIKRFSKLEAGSKKIDREFLAKHGF